MGEVIEVGGMVMVVRRPANDVLPVCGRHWVAVSAMMKAGARPLEWDALVTDGEWFSGRRRDWSVSRDKPKAQGPVSYV